MNIEPKTYYSNGKLLITGEYVVLDGALSLALPTKFGQSLEIEILNEPTIIWESFDDNGNCWFNDVFSIEEIASGSSNPRSDLSNRVIQILNVAKTINPGFLVEKSGFKISTHLGFPINWGLGTSSTLINNIAHWADVDAFELLEKTFGGSGYDIACAQNNNPITYQLKTFDCAQGEQKRDIQQTDFNPAFKDHLYFVHLNKKQNSREGIAKYKDNKGKIVSAISEINDITTKVISCKDLEGFEFLMMQHERIISKIIKQKTVKELLFSDFNGSVKSLGAWGGDFVLVASKENPISYFKKKGFNTMIPFEEMLL